MKYKFDIEGEVYIVPPAGSYEDLEVGYILDRRMFVGKPEYYVEWLYGNLTWEWETDLQYAASDDARTYCDFQDKIRERMK